jgi:hypothetical protein
MCRDEIGLDLSEKKIIWRGRNSFWEDFRNSYKSIWWEVFSFDLGLFEFGLVLFRELGVFDKR